MNEIFFFDTYALIELIKGNKNYEKYEDANLVITKLNLFELYYSALKDSEETIASIMLEKYSDFTIDFDNNTIELAAKFKLLNKKLNLSMTDCIGYILAKQLGITFLTGDKQFKNMDNVEFVK